ncbi:MAG: sigma-70 family RNA polymerase sigma factor [Verrucomicrobiota bacterium]
MAHSSPDTQFLLQITDSQQRLFGYIVTLLGDVHDAHDVLQETNLVIWQKSDSFEPGSNFEAWSRKIAWYQSLAFLRNRKRDRHVYDDDVMELLAQEMTEPLPDEERELALRDCLFQLSDAQRGLIKQRYDDGLSVKKLADGLGRKESATKMMLMRIRRSLLRCIESKLREEAAI